MEVDRAATATAEPYPGDPAGHFPPLDGLRGVAVLMIILHHNFHPEAGGNALVGLVRIVADSTWMGVNLFFVLSGFLIGGILIDSRGTPGYFGTFYARRALRIFPLYYVFLLGFFFVATPLADGMHLPVKHVANKWPMWLYYTNMPAPATPVPRAIAPIWSLAVEEQIYLVWPAVIALLAPRRLLVMMLALFPLSFLWRGGVMAAHRSIMWAYAWTPACLDAFAAGTIAAIFARRLGQRAEVRRVATLALGGSGLFLAGLTIGLEEFFFWHDPKAMLTFGLTGLCIFFGALILHLVTSPPGAWPNRLLAARWLRSAGRYSYAMYLFHCPVGGLIRAVTNSRFEASTGVRSLVEQGAFFLVSLALTYALALASWNLIERPFLRLKNYFPSRGRGVPTFGGETSATEAAGPEGLALAHTTSSGSSTASASSLER